MNLVDQPVRFREMVARDAVKRVPDIARNHRPCYAKSAQPAEATMKRQASMSCRYRFHLPGAQGWSRPSLGAGALAGSFTLRPVPRPGRTGA